MWLFWLEKGATHDTYAYLVKMKADWLEIIVIILTGKTKRQKC